MFKEHQMVELVDDYSKRGLPVGSKGTIVYIYPNKETFEVEFPTHIASTVLTLQHYQIKEVAQ